MPGFWEPLRIDSIDNAFIRSHRTFGSIEPDHLDLID